MMKEDEVINMFINGDDYFDQIRNERVVLWGAGSKGKQTLKLLLEMNIKPLAVIDNDSKKWGGALCEIPIISYENARKAYKGSTILIGTVWTHAVEIEKELGTWKGKVLVCANPFKAEIKFLSRSEIMNNEKSFVLSYNLLEDDKSKDLFREVVNWKITGDSTLPAAFTDEESVLEWFDFEKLDSKDTYTYVDVGAYTGDTVVRYMLFSGFRYNEIIAIEPDLVNRNSMIDVLNKLRLNRGITYIDQGIWSEKTELEFYSSGKEEYESSNFIQSADNVICDERQRDGDCGIAEMLSVDTIDNVLREKGGKLLIKIDVQGSEYAALMGAKDTIRNRKPVLILEFATFSKHIADIIPNLYDLNNEYKFYLRQKLLSGNSRPVLYVV